MTKQTTTITLDPDILSEAKRAGINISKETNEYLKTLICRSNEDLDGINIRLERIELEKGLERLKYWQERLKTTQTRIEKWEEKQKRDEEERLKAEKEAFEAAKKCVCCDRVIGDGEKKFVFPVGQICKGCFFGASSDAIREWNTPKINGGETMEVRR